MPLVTLYRLRPRGPLHAGARGLVTAPEGGGEGQVVHLAAQPFPSAATVFSAWCWAIRDLAGAPALVAWLDGFTAGRPPLLLAEPLPWIGPVLLLPRLALPPGATAERRPDGPRDKRGKRYRWVEERLWFRLAAGAAVDDAFADDNAFHQGQTIWAAGAAGAALREQQARQAAALGQPAGAAPPFWRVETLPHVTVDRQTGAGNIYHTSATWFAPGVDLALPVVWRDGDPAQRALAERALLLLGEEGIGGERRAGYGQFDLIETETRDWPDLDGAPAFATLSGYHPARDEVAAGVFAAPARYELAVSGGWVERATVRHAVRLVTAGSVLRRPAGRALFGQLVDVTPAPFDAHRVYRYGYAFPLPVAAGQEE